MTFSVSMRVMKLSIIWWFARKRMDLRWTLHNLVGHPLLAIFLLVGLRRLGGWVHDVTQPKG